MTRLFHYRTPTMRGRVDLVDSLGLGHEALGSRCSPAENSGPDSRVGLTDEPEIQVSFRVARHCVAYRLKLSELNSDRLFRLVRVNWEAVLFGISAVVLLAILAVDIYRAQATMLGSLMLALLAMLFLGFAIRYRTLTWYYFRVQDSMSPPFLFPCPRHLATLCESALEKVRAQAAAGRATEPGS